MRRYHSPKDYLDAARNPATLADELRVLADSAYEFVRLAVAEHLHTEADTLVALIPQRIESWHEQHLAYALARHPHTPAQGLHDLAERLPTVLNRGRNHDYSLKAGVALCNNSCTPLGSIQSMLADPRVSTDVRRLVARETTRVDVLQILVNDRSDVVRKRAHERLTSAIPSGNVDNIE